MRTPEPSSSDVRGEPSAAEDRATLHHFGYAQQLLRDMGGFSNFAISFSIISVLTGAITLYGVGLTAGGPIVMGLGWPLVTLFVLFVASAMAELASAIPTSGALYHWSSLLGGPGWGWLTAWLNLIGLVATVAGIDYGCAQLLAPVLGMPDTPRSDMILFTLLVLSHATLNHIGIRVVARLNDVSAIYHMAGVLIIVCALALFAHLRPISFVFTQRLTTAPAYLGKPYIFCFLGGLLQAQWTYTGFDASAHTVEETKNPRVRAPWGIYLSVAVSGIFGYLLIVFITLAIKDLHAAAADASPVTYIFTHALAPPWGAVMIWIMVLAQWFCGLACVTSTSRMIFAFSRDGGMPMSPVWAAVSRRFRTPAAAVWLGSVLAFLLPLIILGLVQLSPKHMDFAGLYAAITGISTIGLYLSYGLPLALRLRAIRTGAWTESASGPWSLGSWSVPVTVISLAWIAFITVLFVLPPNHLTGVVFAVTLTALALFYFARVRGRFAGPVPQANSEEKLAEIEAQYDR